MAFKNIKIPEENRKEYEIDSEIKKPRFCTIDEDKNVILFGCWTVYEAPHEKIFALVWKEKIVKVHLGYKIENKYTTIWELLAIDIPQDLYKYKDEIIADLRSAMMVYGFDGDISYLCDGDETCLDKVGKTIINFCLLQ